MVLPALVVKEYRTWLRSKLGFVVLTVVVFVLVATSMAGMWAIATGTSLMVPAIGSSTPPTTTLPGLIARNRATVLFFSVAIGALLTVSLVAPAVAASAIQSEKERGTMDLLLSTGLSPLSIVLGKTLTALSFVLVLIATALPAFAPAWTFGGVGFREIGLAALIIVATALLMVAVSVFFSAIASSSLAAAMYAYCIAWLVGPGIVSLYLIASAFNAGDWLRPLLYFDPLLAMLSVPEALGEQAAPFLPSNIKGLLVQPPLELGGRSHKFPLWAGTLVLYSMISLLLLLAAAARCEPLRLRRMQTGWLER